MRGFQIIWLIGLLVAAPLLVSGQSRTFTKDDVEYVIELPSPSWQVVSRLDVHDHFEFIYQAEISNGYLRLRKRFADSGTGATDLFRHDEKWYLKQLPGYVVCSACEGESFQGQLNGVVFAYEYINSGKPMYGRIYYLQIDKRTFYSLSFTVAIDKRHAMHDQMDVIARSFRLKHP